MENQEIINKTVEFVKKTLADAEGGHDRWHIYRVRKTAKNIAQIEHVDMLIVELGALLHDIADSKFYDGNEEIGPQKARAFLESIQIEENVIVHVENIIRHISFKGILNEQKFKSPELDVVQDADRLDAMGAIGIGRTFNYGGHKNIQMYNPEIKPNIHMTKEEFIKEKGTTINHFYEKLLLLKDIMNTKTGKEMAQHRHIYMEHYLEEFYKEREGEV
ncbi:MAG: HD domain-containing protein [candidate division SR1 bacterium]|nr:HD domain-containing protein [candidate division SR1 bacterium]